MHLHIFYWTKVFLSVVVLSPFFPLLFELRSLFLTISLRVIINNIEVRCSFFIFSNMFAWNVSQTFGSANLWVSKSPDWFSFLFFIFYIFTLSMPATKKRSEPQSAPRKVLTPRTQLLNLTFFNTWSIWLVYRPSGNLHVPLCTSLWGNIVLLIFSLLPVAKSINLHPLLFEVWYMLYMPIVSLKFLHSFILLC